MRTAIAIGIEGLLIIALALALLAFMGCSRSPYYDSNRAVAISAYQQTGDSITSATLTASHDGAAWYGDQGTTASLTIGADGALAATVDDQTGKGTVGSMWSRGMDVLAGALGGLVAGGGL